MTRKNTLLRRALKSLRSTAKYKRNQRRNLQRKKQRIKNLKIRMMSKLLNQQLRLSRPRNLFLSNLLRSLL